MNPQIPPYISEALSIFRPPEKLTVSEWADKYRELSEKDSAEPGRWRTARTPYLKEIMDTFNRPDITDIIFCAGTQIGKTAMEQNMLGYAIDQDPGPCLIVYPTDDLAKFTSSNRLQPMIQLSQALHNKYLVNESADLELQFTGMYVSLVGANSPSKLASRPVRYLFFDEIDKFPQWSGSEASPIDLAEERTKTFWNRKRVKVSTPTLDTGNIWQAWKHADAQYEYEVCCPHCGKWQTFVFKQIKWPESAAPQEAAMAAYYECGFCKARIDDAHKISMIRAGKWKIINDPKGRIRSVGFRLSSLYSPWLTWGDIASQFLRSKDQPESLMNFVNSWLAEPWVNKANRLRSDVVMEKQLAYSRGVIPADAQLITMGVDVQLDHFWWGIRAWGAHMTSWLVDYGRVETWADLERFLLRDWPDSNGEIRNVNLCCIDSGFHPEEVYMFCANHFGLAVPTKGSSRQLTTRYNISRLDKGQSRYAYSLNLYTFDTSQFKDFITGRLSIEAGVPGSWNVYQGVDRRYCDMVCAEQKVEHQDKKGRITFTWEKISSHADNHMLDVETNNALAAEILGVRYLQEEPFKDDAKAKPNQSDQSDEDDYWSGLNLDF